MLSSTQTCIAPLPLSKFVSTDEHPQSSDSDSLRPFFAEVNIFNDRKGSAYVEVGSTKVTCIIDGPKEPLKGSDCEHFEGFINVQLKGTDMNLAHIIRSSLEGIVCLELFAKAQIDVEISVIKDDGGLLATSLMAASLALVNADIQTFDLCVACHATIVEDKILIDPDITQISPNCTSVTIGLMPSLNQIVCCDVVGVASFGILKNAIELVSKRALSYYSPLRSCLRAKM